MKPILVLDLPIYHEIVGECIGYVKASPGTETETLSDAMLKAEECKVDHDAYRRILDRYSPETLGKLYESEFREMIGSAGGE